MNSITRTSALAFALLLALSIGVLAREGHSEDEKPKAKGAVFVQNAMGRAKLSKGFSKAVKVKLGRGIAGTGRLHITDWFGNDVISGQVDVENKTDKKLYTAVSLIVFDKGGTPLGAVSQSMSLDPKKSSTWGGFVLKLPAAQLRQVATYRYIWYEDTQKIGSR